MTNAMIRSETPTAAKKHRCDVCNWNVRPGETYHLLVSKWEGIVSTSKRCEHCEAVVTAYCRDQGVDWFDDTELAEWLEEIRPAEHAQMRAGWAYPDGARVPLPFPPHCFTCGTPITRNALWCGPCDEARLARLDASFQAIAAVTLR